MVLIAVHGGQEPGGGPTRAPSVRSPNSLGINDPDLTALALLEAPGFALLREASELCDRMGVPASALLVSVETLTRLGLDRHSLETLRAEGVLEVHGRQSILASEVQVALTSRGQWYARQLLEETEPSQLNWDSLRKELTFNGQLAKRFRRQAPNQILVIEAFQEEGWPERIDDPLSRSRRIRPKRRLRQTVSDLNDGLDFIRFYSDGSGEGIRWKSLTPAHLLRYLG